MSNRDDRMVQFRLEPIQKHARSGMREAGASGEMIRRVSIGNLAGAYYSDCERYRYLLWRRWHHDSLTCSWLNLIMLNPSTATEYILDPTVARCCTRAQMLGFGGLYVTNIFAWRSTDPKALYNPPQDLAWGRLWFPIGPENNAVILETAKTSAMVICAWGNHGTLNHRGNDVIDLLSGIPLYALKVSEKTGMPWHPLYISLDRQPVPYIR